MSIEILNLRDARQFMPDIADRLWHAWGQFSGETLADEVAALEAVVAAPAFPFTLVALVDGAFAGTVSGIASDLDERPELGPWVASLWVEPGHRGAGIARTLVEQATATLFAQGNTRVYLYAIPPLQALYLGMGWTLVEEKFGKLGVDIYIRDAPAVTGTP
ncbi:MAG: GNAT family N-acetyltransferase [Alphaproteobacteria bacterium]|nr:GNAT family N-acetyltransferase [Alphaproteobacteria bacterium]